MRSFYINILFFGLTLSVVVIVAELLLQSNITNHIAKKYEEIYNPKVAADIVLLGTSHVAHSINPCQLSLKNNYSFYNFAFNGGTPAYYLKWYTTVFEPEYPAPHYIIYAVDWAMFDSTLAQRSIEVDARLYSFSHWLSFLLNDSDLSKKQLIFNRTYLMFHRRSLHYIFTEKKKFDFVSMDEYCQGYVPHIAKDPSMGKSPKNTVVCAQWRKDFTTLLDKVEGNGIKLIFVQAPEYAPAWQTPEREQLMAYLDSIAKAREIPYLNYNTTLFSDMNVDSTLYNNWFHFNDKGATAFSKKFSNDLNKILN